MECVTGRTKLRTYVLALTRARTDAAGLDVKRSKVGLVVESLVGKPRGDGGNVLREAPLSAAAAADADGAIIITAAANSSLRHSAGPRGCCVGA